MSTKLVAADIASNAGCTTVIMNGKYPNNIVDIIKEASERESTNKEINPKIGTHFLPNDVLLNDREWWIRFGLAPLGQIQIKPECIKHLIEQKLKHRESSEKLDSIYPIDVEDTQDYFFPNQCISLTTIIKNNDTGKDEIVEVGRALSNYTSSEIQLIKGHDSCDIIKILGETGPKIRKSIVSKENIALSLNKRLLQLFDLF